LATSSTDEQCAKDKDDSSELIEKKNGGTERHWISLTASRCRLRLFVTGKSNDNTEDGSPERYLGTFANRLQEQQPNK
jgi:hypothetical protein